LPVHLAVLASSELLNSDAMRVSTPKNGLSNATSVTRRLHGTTSAIPTKRPALVGHPKDRATPEKTALSKTTPRMVLNKVRKEEMIGLGEDCQRINLPNMGFRMAKRRKVLDILSSMAMEKMGTTILRIAAD
jgi:hypothetical protein